MQDQARIEQYPQSSKVNTLSPSLDIMTGKGEYHSIDMKVAVFLLYMLKSINQSHGFLLVTSCFLDNYGFVIAKAKVNI